ncbi:unnamed protein product [Chrysoparadoxa australica]
MTEALEQVAPAAKPPRASPVPSQALLEEKANPCVTPEIEAEHVQAVYDTIALHWSNTRYKPWPKVAAFLSELPRHSLVADVGCGNGKYLRCAPQCMTVGSDASLPLLEVCMQRHHQKILEEGGEEKGDIAEVLCADNMSLPYRSGVFDAVISIAVLHHFSSAARRLRALEEMSRLLRPGGSMLVYAWAQQQGEDSRRRFETQDVLVPWHLADRLVAPGPSVASHGVRDEEKNSTCYQRYCHVYQEGELEALCEQVETLELVSSYFDCDNWCAVVRKKNCPGAATESVP